MITDGPAAGTPTDGMIVGVIGATGLKNAFNASFTTHDIGRSNFAAAARSCSCVSTGRLIVMGLCIHLRMHKYNVGDASHRLGFLFVRKVGCDL